MKPCFEGFILFLCVGLIEEKHRFQSDDGEVVLPVALNKKSGDVWLNRNQIAESCSEEKETMVSLVMNFLA